MAFDGIKNGVNQPDETRVWKRQRFSFDLSKQRAELFHSAFRKNFFQDFCSINVNASPKPERLIHTDFRYKLGWILMNRFEPFIKTHFYFL